MSMSAACRRPRVQSQQWHSPRPCAACFLSSSSCCFGVRRDGRPRGLPGHHGAAHAGLHQLPRQGGPRRPRRLLPAHRGQAGRIPVRPAAALPGGPPPLRPDGRLLETLSDEYLYDIALHFAQLDLPYPAPQLASAPPEALQRGRELVARGDPERRVPACASCHGKALTGVAPNVPGLLGLPRDYLLAQLGAWRTGQRRALAPDCMAEIARRLAPDDLSAVTAFLAAEPLPGPCQAGGRHPRHRPHPSAGDARRSRLRSRRHRPCAAALRFPRSREPRDETHRVGAGRGAGGAGRLGVDVQLLGCPRASGTAHRPRPRRVSRSRAAPISRGRATACCATPSAAAPSTPVAGPSRRPSAPCTRATSRPMRRRASAAGPPRTSAARCTRAARATGACSTRSFPTRTPPMSPRRTRMRCSTTCAACRRCTSPTGNTACAGRTTPRPRWRCGAPCTSGPASWWTIRRARRSGTAAPTSCRAWATAVPATPRATHSAACVRRWTCWAG